MCPSLLKSREPASADGGPVVLHKAEPAPITTPRPEPAGSPEEALQSLGYDVLGYQPHEIDVVRFDPGQHEQLWDEFLPHTVNGNLFQTRRFLSYHPPDRFTDHSLLFFDQGKFIAVAAAEESEGRWSAHRFSSHGGLAVVPGLRADRCLDLVWSLLKYGGDHGWHRFSMRFAPDCLHRGDLATLFWALEIWGFTQQGKELAWCFMPGPQTEAELLARYSNGARGAVLKAQKENRLTVRQSEDFASYWALLERNLKQRFNVPPTHSLDEIQRLRQLCPGEISLWAVFNENDRMIAGAVIFDVSAAGAHTFYSAQDYEYHLQRPTSLLMHNLCLEHLIRRKKRLNHGVITAHGAQELNLGLSWFKQSFGASPSQRRTFSLEFADA